MNEKDLKYLNEDTKLKLQFFFISFHQGTSSNTVFVGLSSDWSVGKYCATTKRNRKTLVKLVKLPITDIIFRINIDRECEISPPEKSWNKLTSYRETQSLQNGVTKNHNRWRRNWKASNDNIRKRWHGKLFICFFYFSFRSVSYRFKTGFFFFRFVYPLHNYRNVYSIKCNINTKTI